MAKLFIFGLLTLLLQSAACADNNEPDNDEHLKEDADQIFGEIPSVYEASKYDQKVTKAPPASMGVVTADEIKKYGYRNFSDIISSLKGFYNTNDRNYGYVGARGFGIPSDYNTRLLLLIDGHRFNDNIYDSFDTSEGFPVDVDMIERVEIIRGPSSSMYGASAFFGVINIITKRGRDQAGANIKGSYGSNNAYKTSASIGNRFKNGLETFLTGTFYDSQGYNRLYYKEFDTPEQNHGVSVNNDSEQAKKLLATVSYQDFTLQGLYVKRNKDIPTGSFGTVFNNPATNTVDESTYLDLKYNHTFSDQLNVQSRVSYNNYRYQGDYPYDYREDGSSNPFDINKNFSRGQWWRAEINATKVFWNDHKITVGSEFQHNFDQFQVDYDLTTLVDAQDSTYKWALLIQDEYTITDTLTLNTGVRLDYFNNFGKTINPRAGLIYQPWANSSVKLLYGSAFRAPNQFELNYYAAGKGLTQNLKPESLDTLELIFEHYFDTHLRSELDFFRTEICDIIKQTTTTNNLLQHQNNGNAESQGIELQLEDTWNNGFQGRFSYSWQQTVNKETQARLTNSPEHMVKLNMIAPLWLDKVFLGFETQYMSGRKAPLGGMVGDHVINNLTVFTQKWFKGVELSAGAYNLFNERYFDPGADGVHLQNGIQQDGLTFRVKASVDF
jgi:iron complex outermembrane receptor protein